MYFVTVCTKNREHFFGEFIRDGACPVLKTDTPFVPKTDEKMQQIDSFKGWLSVVVGGIKSAVTKFANANNIDFAWQIRFHEHIIREQEEMNRFANYIENNINKKLKELF